MSQYPNLELLAYRFQETLLQNHRDGKPLIPNTEVYVFPQTWGNTAGGFSQPGTMAGQAFIRELTTVMVNRTENSALVSFGNKPAYFVTPLTRKFWADFYKQDMKGIAHCGEYNHTEEDYKDMMEDEPEDEDDGE